MRLILLMIMLLCGSGTLAAGGLYRYVDDMGTINYVDTITKVPERYRIQLLSPEERAKLENKDLTQVLLFPYELVGNDTLKEGLWEDAHDRPISHAKAVRFTRGTARIHKIARYNIHFEHENGDKETIEVFKVKVKAEDFTDLKGKPVPVDELSGFMLKTRMYKD